MIYYLATKFLVPHETGDTVPLKTTANQQKYGVKELHYLGPVEGKFAYSTVPDEALPAFEPIETSLIPSLADRIDFIGIVTDLPTLGQIAARMRALPVGGSVVVPKSAQRNGFSLSNSMNGYYEDVPRFIAAPVIDGGARALRIPIKRKNLWQNGVIQDVVALNGYPTKAWTALKPILEFSFADDVVPVIDDHTYSPYGNEELIPFWVALGSKILAEFGPDVDIRLELQNETSKGGWEVGYADNLKALIKGIRDAGIPYGLIAGWGGWNALSGYTRALSEIDAIGGPDTLDPLGRLEFSAHHYPTTSGNDQAVVGKNAPQIKGTSLSPGWQTAFEEFKRRGLKLWITEIGMGGGARGWLSNGSGAPDFNGEAWFNAFTALVQQYPDTVAGVLAWGGGSAWPDAYPFKLEYAKDNWAATKSTEFWRSITAFWK